MTPGKINPPVFSEQHSLSASLASTSVQENASDCIDTIHSQSNLENLSQIANNTNSTPLKCRSECSNQQLPNAMAALIKDTSQLEKTAQLIYELVYLKIYLSQIEQTNYIARYKLYPFQKLSAVLGKPIRTEETINGEKVYKLYCMGKGIRSINSNDNKPMDNPKDNNCISINIDELKWKKGSEN
jgi:hypothetical protein